MKKPYPLERKQGFLFTRIALGVLVVVHLGMLIYLIVTTPHP